MQSVRAYRGPPIFSFGFRPFFLVAALWAAAAIPIWLYIYARGSGMVGAMAGRDWHVHEMLFGYLPGVVAGFLLTAVPNWTGRLPVMGLRLAGLSTLWIAGRIAMLLNAQLGWVAQATDAAFLLVLAAVIWREVVAGRNLRNLPVCVMVSLLALANLAFHLRMIRPGIGMAPERLALAVSVLLIALIGGRIIPSFTRNWMAQRSMAPEPTPFGMLDKAVLAVTGVALAAWTAAPDRAPGGALLCVAGAANLVRLWRWRGVRTRAEPLVWVLHAGYAWLAVGLILLGGSILESFVPRSSGIHALTAGAIGVMTLAVMTRATLGHTGRERRADRPTLLIYLLINSAALVRIAAPWAGGAMVALLAVSGLLWSFAFGLFALAYGPMLIKPRGA
jgi:uncharacterized protein involved in response to NO